MKRYSIPLITVLITTLACGGYSEPVSTVLVIEDVSPTEVPTAPPTATAVPTATALPTSTPTKAPEPTLVLPTPVVRSTSVTTPAVIARYDSSWETIKGSTFDLGFDTKANLLTLTLKQPGLWLNNSQGGAVYRNTNGNFKITAIVKATKSTTPTDPPGNRIHLGGLIVRNPAGTTENYVHIVVGNAENRLAIEAKNTTNNVSQYDTLSWTSGSAELRLCRVGSDINLYRRAVNATTWLLATTYTRADFPASLQVGASIYSATAPDLRLTFENLRIEEVREKGECER
ncbi:MAG: hypothetical protein AABZ78_13940, partial [Chloroflexota bacterium]